MNKIHTQRFEAAKALFQKLIDIPDDYRIFYCGDIIQKSSIKITDKTILVWINANCMETWFEYDPSWDHGVYSTIKEYEKLVRDSFKVVKFMENW